MSNYYAVLRLDSKLIGKDIFGRDIPCKLEEGQYMMPVFSTRAAAEEYANGKYDVITLSATEAITEP